LGKRLVERSQETTRGITPLEHYWICLTSKHFDREGRASRKEFWSFALFQVIFGSLVFAITVLVDPFVRRFELVSDELPIPVAWLFLGGLFCIGTQISSFSVAIRRMHDWGRSGKLLLVSFSPYAIFVLGIFFEEKSFALMVTMIFVPTIAMITICVALLSVRSNAGPNKYGPAT
jgi:uncharacterized membrane protein YhaH (DUF805 family)